MASIKIILFSIFIHFTLNLNGYMPKVPKVYEIAPWYDFKPAAITYSFDDGTFNQIQKGVPLLDKYYLKGSLT